MTDRDFDILIKNALTDAAISDAEDFDEIFFSEKYHKRKSAFLNKAFRMKRRAPQWKKVLIHAAVLVIVFLMGCSSTLLLPPQHSLTGLIKTYTRSFPNGDEIYDVTFSPKGDEPDDGRFWRPTYVPEGFTDYTFRTRSHSNGSFFIGYTAGRDDSQYVRFSQFRLATYGAGGTLKNHKLTISKVNNSEAYLYTSSDPDMPHMLFWLSDNGSTLFRIDASCTIDTDEMFKMAESIEVFMDMPFGSVAQVDITYSGSGSVEQSDIYSKSSDD